MFRDSWITLQSRIESVVLRKTELNGILIGKDNMQFTRMFNLKDTENKLLEQSIADILNYLNKNNKNN